MSKTKKALYGKKILLIALPGYSNGIIKQMQELGAEVDYIRDKPNERFICKTLGRLQVNFYQKVIDKYYYKKIQELESKQFDFILVIRGEYTTINALKRLRKTFSKARIILYMWDGLHKQNTKNIEQKWKYYDKVFTFDRMDYKANPDHLSFLPLYYYEEYLPKKLKDSNSINLKYDISFIGTGHADRVKIIKNVMLQCKKVGKRTFQYIYIPHPIVFWGNKIVNRDYKKVSLQDVRFKMLSFEKLYNTYANSHCIVDVENPGQHGLTMRSIEIIGLKRKLITTNPDIINYDFYNSNNIMVLDRKNPNIDMTFFDKPYEILPDSIYEKYSLKNWILEVLK